MGSRPSLHLRLHDTKFDIVEDEAKNLIFGITTQYGAYDSRYSPIFVINPHNSHQADAIIDTLKAWKKRRERGKDE